MSNASSSLSAIITQQTQSSSYQNAIAFCVDNKYLPYALFVAQQLLHLNENAYDICVCVPDLTQIPAVFLQKNIRFVEMQVLGLDNLPVGKLSLAAYNRLFLPQLFANDYQYIIYLDADTFINRAFYHDMMQVIAEFNTDFCIAAAPDIVEIVRVIEPNTKTFRSKLPYLNYYQEREHTYRNSGILVFNINNCLNANISNKILNYAFNNIKELLYHDQSALNKSLLGDLALLPFTYNWQLHKLVYHITQEVNPYIIHFIGENKPWSLDNKYTKPYIKYYHEFLTEFFPSIASYPVTKDKQREQSPKYANPIKEAISVFGRNIKSTFKPLDENSVATSEQVNQTRNILQKPPFSSWLYLIFELFSPMLFYPIHR